MIIPRLSCLALVVLCAFIALVNAAADLSSEKPYQNEGPTALGVKMDLNFARTWPDLDPKDPTSPVNDETDGIEDGQLWQMALTAYNEMLANQEAYKVPRPQRPTAMTILAFDHEVILASSQKGASFSYHYLDTPVAKALARCQTMWRNSYQTEAIHRRQGQCVHPATPLSSQKARIATIVSGNQEDPCTDSRGVTFGCNLFVQEYGFEVLDKSQAYKTFDLSEIAGGIEERSQIQLCYSPDESNDGTDISSDRESELLKGLLVR
ncbi:hypothetical protein ASPACDRAFT_61957 [Aspergillus aculeatus ATCC 16872]|uniref:Uncharacterized protein n=1 Tax=Aspergillus aculeatus (strain ATCC 16872 / CBS 172.66 / WB 5094) TaxID=690307 RepID=A0A1L9WQJ2_ASPA1|nr:uncharacterized protein ASPACDRAFT_61957 [Aspergillus aculeatus ATCC 16872]OJJ98443.1 hypothetical protein ASPACDRAFT_61957 [Aspergillus aculeatus ATCC 16872]